MTQVKALSAKQTDFSRYICSDNNNYHKCSPIRNSFDLNKILDRLVVESRSKLCYNLTYSIILDEYSLNGCRREVKKNILLVYDNTKSTAAVIPPFKSKADTIMLIFDTNKDKIN